MSFDQLLVPVTFASTLLCHKDPDVAIRGPKADGDDPRRREVSRVSQGAAQTTRYVHQNIYTYPIQMVYAYYLHT